MTHTAATIRRLVLLVSILLLFAGLVAAALPRHAAETAYVGCVGIGHPADVGVCVPAPYPERLPLPD